MDRPGRERKEDAMVTLGQGRERREAQKGVKVAGGGSAMAWTQHQSMESATLRWKAGERSREIHRIELFLRQELGCSNFPLHTIPLPGRSHRM